MGWTSALAVALLPVVGGRDPAPLTVDRIRTDLRVVAALASPGQHPAGMEVFATATLVNTSAEFGYRVVEPGDGSEPGWREPYVYWTATVDRGDGKPIPVPDLPGGRCSVFDANWTKDVVRLGPGGRMALGWSSPRLDCQQAGRVALRAHYAYRTGRGFGWPRPRGPMAGVPAFELVSAPVEFEVVRPLDLRLSVKRKPAAGREEQLSELFDVRLVNRSGTVWAVNAPSNSAGPRLFAQFDPPDVYRTELAGAVEDVYAVRGVLPPGGSAGLLRGGELPNGYDGRWRCPVGRPVTVRFVYWPGPGPLDGTRIASDWVMVSAGP